MSKMLNVRDRLACLSGLALVVLAGCTAVDDRQGVTGVVTVDGAPLELGAISFMPHEELAAASSGVTVRDGRFEIPADRGLRPGRYTVRIRAYRKADGATEDPQMGEQLELEELRFEETDLEAIVEEDGPNHFEFALTMAL